MVASCSMKVLWSSRHMRALKLWEFVHNKRQLCSLLTGMPVILTEL